MTDAVAVAVDEETSKLLLRVSKNIKAQRLARGLKQTDMGQYGFGYRWYQRLESGRHVPTLPTLIKLAKALEIDISELFR
ncbi:MAG: helix-turn-helix domain-containing protein [Bacteriovoracaceae bacterium]|jgi:transcriptional regulator with XRE-family HTH domain